MWIDGYEFMTDCVSKFHRYLHVSGWFHHQEDPLVEVAVEGLDVVHVRFAVGLPHGGVEASLGPGKGFELEILRPSSDGLPETAMVHFITSSGRRLSATLLALAEDRASRWVTPRMTRDFVAQIDSIDGAKVLDIGGRARSGLDRSKDFKRADVTVLDIMAGENVDVIGDAHELSKLFQPETFDAIYCSSVFEHLMMPWKVAVEINRVLKTGGCGLISTHQALGMHDIPWDFWRFSDTAWDALFNQKTGFEIIERSLDAEQFLIPFLYRPSKADAERSAGFEASAVCFRKIGPCEIDWPVKMSDISTTFYPDTDDGQAGRRDWI